MSSVLVTGGAGYIGSHTCVALMEAGWEVALLDSLENSSIAAVDAVSEIAGRGVRLVVGDCRDESAVEKALTEASPDAGFGARFGGRSSSVLPPQSGVHRRAADGHGELLHCVLLSATVYGDGCLNRPTPRCPIRSAPHWSDPISTLWARILPPCLKVAVGVVIWHRRAARLHPRYGFGRGTWALQGLDGRPTPTTAECEVITAMREATGVLLDRPRWYPGLPENPSINPRANAGGRSVGARQPVPVHSPAQPLVGVFGCCLGGGFRAWTKLGRHDRSPTRMIAWTCRAGVRLQESEPPR